MVDKFYEKTGDLMVRYSDYEKLAAEIEPLQKVRAAAVALHNEIAEDGQTVGAGDSVVTDLALALYPLPTKGAHPAPPKPPPCRSVKGDTPRPPPVPENVSGQYKFRAGDVVRHLPTNETWILAFGDREDTAKKVCAAGWPLTIADPSHCEMVLATSDEDSAAMLADCAKLTHQGDIRSIVARNYLAETGKR